MTDLDIAIDFDGFSPEVQHLPNNETLPIAPNLTRIFEAERQDEADNVCGEKKEEDDRPTGEQENATKQIMSPTSSTKKKSKDCQSESEMSFDKVDRSAEADRERVDGEHTQTDVSWSKSPVSLREIYNKLQENKDLKTPCKDKLTLSVVKEYDVDESDGKKRQGPSLADCCIINYHMPEVKYPRLANESCLFQYKKFFEPLLRSISFSSMPEINELFVVRSGEIIKSSTKTRSDRYFSQVPLNLRYDANSCRLPDHNSYVNMDKRFMRAHERRRTQRKKNTGNRPTRPKRSAQEREKMTISRGDKSKTTDPEPKEPEKPDLDKAWEPLDMRFDKLNAMDHFVVSFNMEVVRNISGFNFGVFLSKEQRQPLSVRLIKAAKRANPGGQLVKVKKTNKMKVLERNGIYVDHLNNADILTKAHESPSHRAVIYGTENPIESESQVTTWIAMENHIRFNSREESFERLPVVYETLKRNVQFMEKALEEEKDEGKPETAQVIAKKKRPKDANKKRPKDAKNDTETLTIKAQETAQRSKGEKSNERKMKTKKDANGVKGSSSKKKKRASALPEESEQAADSKRSSKPKKQRKLDLSRVTAPSLAKEEGPTDVNKVPGAVEALTLDVEPQANNSFAPPAIPRTHFGDERSDVKNLTVEFLIQGLRSDSCFPESQKQMWKLSSVFSKFFGAKKSLKDLYGCSEENTSHQEDSDICKQEVLTTNELYWEVKSQSPSKSLSSSNLEDSANINCNHDTSRSPKLQVGQEEECEAVAEDHDISTVEPIKKKLKFAKDPTYGYLSFDPAYIGTGLKLFLLLRMKYIGSLLEPQAFIEDFKNIGFLRFNESPRHGSHPIFYVYNLCSMHRSSAFTIMRTFKALSCLVQMEVDLSKCNPQLRQEKVMAVEPIAYLFRRLQAGPANRMSYTKKYLRRGELQLMRLRQTKLGGSLAHCIRHNVYLKEDLFPRACDPGAYDQFADLFDPILCDHNGLSVLRHTRSLLGSCEDLKNLEFRHPLILSYSVRFVRNLRGFGFPPMLSATQRRLVEWKLLSKLHVLSRREATVYHRLGEIYGKASFRDPSVTINAKAKCISTPKAQYDLPMRDSDVSRYLGAYRGWPHARGFFYIATDADRADAVVWINIKDHLRLVSTDASACNLGKPLQTCKEVLREVEAAACGLLARDEKRGFLTYNPAEAGSGMRLSAAVRLPNLSTDMQELREVLLATKLQLIDLHKRAKGSDRFTVCNRYRMGSTEIELARSFVKRLRMLLQAEAACR